MNPTREQMELAAKELITAGRLKEFLSYDPLTGTFVWIKTKSKCARAGKATSLAVNGDGYRHIYIDGRTYKAHRLAWLYVHGEWPSGQIDHINGVKDDNRLTNLRDVSNKTNSRNQNRAHKDNKVGALGVTTRPRGKYQATITVDGKKLYLGQHETSELASQAYAKAKVKFHEGALL